MLNRHRRGFTLVELLVVIGIIALLLSVLLPVLGGVQRRGRDLKCQSNLRTCAQLFLTYAAENKGSLPFGWYYNKSSPSTWDDLGGDQRLTTCFSLISKMSGKQYKGDDVFYLGGPSNPENPRNNYAPFLRCPEAELVVPHICSYVIQYTAFITPYYERVIVPFPGPIQDKPSRVSDLMPFTILLHDTAVFRGMNEDVGYVDNADVDAQSFWKAAANPQRRYYTKVDPYAAIVNPALARFAQHRPVGFAQEWLNIDPVGAEATSFAGYPYQGNLRFRHGKNNAVNVAYADGRVESISADFLPTGAMKKHNIPRRAFMPKWPSGMGLKYVGP
jgi:prepilin-type N-terminal cleavage/methylation domain-containing protein/prepilin-type processing-associated H-X9-DG protein